MSPIASCRRVHFYARVHMAQREGQGAGYHAIVVIVVSIVLSAPRYASLPASPSAAGAAQYFSSHASVSAAQCSTDSRA